MNNEEFDARLAGIRDANLAKRRAARENPTPAQQEQRRAEAERHLAEAQAAATRAAALEWQAHEEAKKAQASANQVARRLPLPAPIKIITGAPPARGVPRKFNLERQRQYLDSLAKGTTRNDAAKVAGVSTQTIKNYRDSDADFAAAELEAEAQVNQLVKEALLTAALAGNVQAQLAWLYNRDADNWTPPQKMQVEISGQVEHVNVETTMAEITMLEETLRARVLRSIETPAIEAGADDAEIVDED